MYIYHEMALDYIKVYGPYKSHHGRLIVIVVEKDGTKRTVTYPKFIMEKHLGYKLDVDSTVDHIDSNIDNNDLSNLKVVPRAEHSANDTRRVLPATLKCSWCKNLFERSPRVVRDKHRKGVSGAFCSRSCSGKYARAIQLGLIDKKFAPPPKVKSVYYKRKYVQASMEDIEIVASIDMEDCFTFENLILHNYVI
jgi:hypothetical protein